tara:strand:- start:5122 stop:5424 length:303 start_codon:yes stop_codon:yes gene_type:complete
VVFYILEIIKNEPFTAKLNNGYELLNVDNLTFIKEEYEGLSFPDSRGRIVFLSDPKFQNKLVILQIMRTWCPNYLDESKFLVNYLKEKSTKKIEVIALVF